MFILDSRVNTYYYTKLIRGTRHKAFKIVGFFGRFADTKRTKELTFSKEQKNACEIAEM